MKSVVLEGGDEFNGLSGLERAMGKGMKEFWLFSSAIFVHECKPETLSCHPLFIVHCPSLIAHCSSLIVHCSLFIAHRPSLIAHCSSLIVHRSLFIVHCPSLIAHCSLSIQPRNTIDLHQRITRYAAVSGHRSPYRRLFTETAAVHFIHGVIICQIM